jgi:DNA-binding NarL/FixJ family response regulator
VGKWGNDLSDWPERSESDPTVSREQLYQLSVRELEVLSLLAEGKSNKEIARDLYITHSTVKSHVAHILRVLQLDSRTSAAVYWTEALHEKR